MSCADSADRVYAGEIGDDLVGKSIAEVLGLVIVVRAGEGQDDQRTVCLGGGGT